MCLVHSEWGAMCSVNNVHTLDFMISPTYIISLSHCHTHTTPVCLRRFSVQGGRHQLSGPATEMGHSKIF